MTQLDRCVMCDYKGKLEPSTFSHRVQVGPVRFDGQLAARACPRCEEEYVDGAMMEKFELLIARHLADNSQRTPQAFQFMRKALGMRAVDLAELIGVGAQTISRYENGAREIEPVRFGVLATLVEDRLAGQDDARARFLAARQPVQPMPRRVVLKVA